MNKTLFAALFLTITNFGAAMAQTQSEPVAQKKPPVQVQYKQMTRYDFDNDQVDGVLVRPDWELVDGMKKSRFSSMVKARQNFIPEMTKSVEGL